MAGRPAGRQPIVSLMHCGNKKQHAFQSLVTSYDREALCVSLQIDSEFGFEDPV